MLTASLQSTWGGNSAAQDTMTSPANSSVNILAQQQQQLRQQTHSRQKAPRYGIPSNSGTNFCSYDY